jgi:hypothetical protein
MRNLATVQRIKALDPLPKKDKIVYASFEDVDFKVIVGTEHKVGDKVIFIEADSILPVKPEYEFLRARCYNDKWNGFRIRNMKMAQVYSQGLVLPLSDTNLKVGTDLTDKLGIVKYDLEAEAERKYWAGSKKPESKLKLFMYRYWLLSIIYQWIMTKFYKRNSYAWPKFASVSDETRVQNLGYIYEQYKEQMFYATEKLDGQSALYAIYNKQFIVCSRRINLKRGGEANNYWTYAKDNDVERRLRDARKDMRRDFYIQGELCGPGIQGNKYSFPVRKLFVFNIRFIDTNEYMDLHSLVGFCRLYGFTPVPFLSTFEFNFKNIEELLAFADGYSVLNKNTLREGVVIRSVAVRPPDQGQANMLSFKVISPSFDIKYMGD